MKISKKPFQRKKTITKRLKSQRSINEFFTEINTNCPISYFLVDDGDFGYGMVLAAFYKKFIDLQNSFLNQIINSKSEILSCFKEQLSQEIMVQDASQNEILDLNKINDEFFNDIISKNTTRDIFRDYKTEKTINYYNLNIFDFNYENIERELGFILLPGLKRFKAENNEIRFITYKYEAFRGSKSSIITNYNEKYPYKELNENQIEYIFEFINKEEIADIKDDTSKQKNIKQMLFSLQVLIDYIQKENFDKNESLYKIIKKLPKQIDICKDLKSIFIINEKENKKSTENDDDAIFFSVNQLINVFEIFEHLCWNSIKNNLVGDYLQNIDPTWLKKIKKYFNQLPKKKTINSVIFCTAIRKFISRYLSGKRAENEINENNTLMNEILRPELWKPFFTESDSFEIEVMEIMKVLTHDYEGTLKVGQALSLYNGLGGDEIIIENAKINFVY